VARRTGAQRPTISVMGLDDVTNAMVNRLMAKLDAKMRRNMLRSAYYDGKRAARQVTAVLPPQYQQLAITLGWTAKSVDLLARRGNLESYTWADGDLGDLGFAEVWDGNMLGSEASQGMTSSLIHSTSFAISTAGGAGEPDVVIQFRDATMATGDWDVRARKLSSLLTITSYDTNGDLDGFVLYIPNLTITCKRTGNKWTVANRQEHLWGVPAEPLPYKPRLGRPFGQSRITRPQMGLQDAAVRELLRLEGHMDVYSFPEMWMLGADPSIFKDQSGAVKKVWDVMIGRIKGIPDDEDATVPRADVKQFSASSPAPHLADLNALSKLFAREASLPDSSLAITDFANPTSADAYDASQYDLIAEAEGATDDWSPGLRRTMIRSLAMKNGIRGDEEIPKEWMSISPKWRNPRFVSRAAEADAGMKQLQSMPWLADTEVGLELIGLTDEQIRRAQGERRRTQGNVTLANIADGAVPTATDDAQATKDKIEALGMAIRFGADPEVAAGFLGLKGLKFTGAVPVTLRQPQSDAAALEDQ